MSSSILKMSLCSPRGKSAVLLFSGGESVCHCKQKAGIVTDQKLVASHHVMMDPAYVHITRQSETDKALKKQLLAKSGIYSIGRYGSWTYCSLEDNIHEAFSLAEEISSL